MEPLPGGQVQGSLVVPQKLTPTHPRLAEKPLLIQSGTCPWVTLGDAEPLPGVLGTTCAGPCVTAGVERGPSRGARLCLPAGPGPPFPAFYQFQVAWSETGDAGN